MYHDVAAFPTSHSADLASQQRSLRRAARRRSIDLSDLQRGGSAASSWGGLSDLASTHSTMWDPFSSIASRTSIDTLLRTMSRCGRPASWAGGQGVLQGWARCSMQCSVCSRLPACALQCMEGALWPAFCFATSPWPVCKPAPSGHGPLIMRRRCYPIALCCSVGHMLGSPTSTMRRAGSMLFRDDFGIGLATSWLHPHGSRCGSVGLAAYA